MACTFGYAPENPDYRGEPVSAAARADKAAASRGKPGEAVSSDVRMRTLSRPHSSHNRIASPGRRVLLWHGIGLSTMLHGGNRRRLHDGTRAILFEPHELIERLAALVPKPRINLLFYHGVLGPSASLRSSAVAAAVAVSTRKVTLEGSPPENRAPPQGALERPVAHHLRRAE